MVGKSSVVNSAKNMARMQEELSFAAAYAEIHRIEDANKVTEKRKKAQDLEDCAPAAARELGKDISNVAKLTIQELELLLHILSVLTASPCREQSPSAGK